MKWLWLVLLVACANPITTATKTATQTAVDTLASPQSQIDIKKDVAAARDEALGPNTQKQLSQLGDLVHDQVMRIRNDALDPAFVGPLREQALGATTKERVGELREELVGQPLRDDVDALLDHEKPRLDALASSLVTSATQPVQQELGLWKNVAIGAVVGVCALLLCLGLCVWLIRSHHRILRQIELKVKT